MKSKQYINVPNGESIPNLPPDAILELPCKATMDGIEPQPVGEFPRGVLGLQHQVIDTHDLTVEAAVSYDRTLVRRIRLIRELNESGYTLRAIGETYLARR